MWFLGALPMSTPSTVKLGMSLWVSIRIADFVICFTCASILFKLPESAAVAFMKAKRSANETSEIAFVYRRIQWAFAPRWRTNARTSLRLMSNKR